MRARPSPASALLLVLALAACTQQQTAPPDDAPGSATPSASPPSQALTWRPVPGPVGDQVTVSGRWTLTLPESGDQVRIDGPDPRVVEAGSGYRVTEALVDGQYAVVVAEHEQATEPNDVTVVDLAEGEVVEADVAPGTGGAFALGSGLLASTTTQGRDYCVGTVDLTSGRAGDGPCVPPRHGISNLTVGPAGTSAMTFDDGRPSCRTLARIEGDTFRPLPGVTECRGWEALTTETFAIWSELENERRIEAATFFLDAGSGTVELGPGTTGSLTWCGGAAYLVRDPQRSSDPARLLRVDVEAGGTEVVYETEATGRAFLSEPRCGGSDLTLTAYTARGDEQVTAELS